MEACLDSEPNEGDSSLMRDFSIRQILRVNTPTLLGTVQTSLPNAQLQNRLSELEYQTLSKSGEGPGNFAPESVETSHPQQQHVDVTEKHIEDVIAFHFRRIRSYKWGVHDQTGSAFGFDGHCTPC